MNGMLHHHEIYREGVQRHQQEAQTWARNDRLARLVRAARTGAEPTTRASGLSALVASWSRRMRHVADVVLRQAAGQQQGPPPSPDAASGGRDRVQQQPDHLTSLLREKRLTRAPGRTTISRATSRPLPDAGRQPRSRRSVVRGPARRRHPSARTRTAARTRPAARSKTRSRVG